MKKSFLLLTILLYAAALFSQSKVDSLVNIGIQYHDNGAYELAIEKYKEALVYDAKSPLANYELAMTYMYTQDYQKAVEHCDIVLEQNELYILETYITKGSCLDYLGDTKASIKLFKKGLKKLGEHHLFYYNLGYDYYKIKDDKKAEASLIKAIDLKPSHASSHLLLGYLMADKNYKSQSLLCLHYFLFLEPESNRSGAAYDLLMQQFVGSVEVNGNDPGQITIYVDPSGKSEFSAADLMISMLEASRSLEENEGKTNEEMFIENTTSFFKVLGEMKEDKNEGIWWEFYVPLFYKIAKSEHMETYCNYISLSGNQNAGAWFQDNEDKVKAFAEWLSNL